VADPSDAPHYDDDELDDDEAADMFETFPLGGLTNLEFELLWAIVEGRPWIPEPHSLEAIAEPQEDLNTWIFRFPSRFVSQLAELKAHQVAPFAARLRSHFVHIGNHRHVGARVMVPGA
jgi:hypothetical protein